ncbi:phosphoprotein [Carollia bat paramyxovirus]|nr:phosphoprotein [Carollia bat paramyxovirus]
MSSNPENIYKRQIQSIDNGISAIKFIQENKEQIQKTYGRSAIQSPSTRTRSAAWEEYLKNYSALHTGSSTSGLHQREDNKRDSHDINRDHGSQDWESGLPNTTKRTGPSTNIDSGWTSEDHSGNHGREWLYTEPDNRRNDRERGFESPGIDEFKTSNPKNKTFDSENWGEDVGISGELTKEETSYPNYVRQFKEIEEPITPEVFKELMPIPTVSGLVSNSERSQVENPTQQSVKPKAMPRLRSIDNDSTFSDNSIKKGIEESTQLNNVVIKSSLNSGATPFVPRSMLYPNLKDVCVETAPKSAKCVSTTPTINLKRQESTTLSSIDSDESLGDKIDMLITNQNKLITKLNMVYELKEEVSNIKKILNNQGLMISTIESYIKDMMIIIPGSGKPQSPNKLKTDINPDLRPVIGRDNSRALNEIIDEPMYFQDDLTGHLVKNPKFKEPIAKRQLFLEPVDDNKNNAVNFQPKGQKASLFTIMSLVKSQVKDSKLRNEIMSMIEEYSSKLPIDDIYKIIIDIIENHIEH